MIKLAHEGATLCFILMAFLAIPLMSEIHFVLNLWLGIVPEYACIFTNLVMIFCILSGISSIVMDIVEATGKIKKTSLTNGSIYIMVLPVTYIAFKMGAPAWVPFAYNGLAYIIGTMCNVYYMTTYIPQLSLKDFVGKTMLPCFLFFGAVALPVVMLHFCMEEGWLRFILSLVVSSLFAGFLSYRFMIDKELREKIIAKIKSKF